ncbi:glycoside hydrolase family 79 protein [Clohesyomyces aquaticus]|uniref:Glycoside hydrolase family 79 protein n=1 Tax=Clohesyomyces aquaticus TaxID=1231657 RepID=A0A1Y1YMG2_9PLEO|nr:glycoside hydrolase family 79 protein [Clohesyomyces aquaticus]
MSRFALLVLFLIPASPATASTSTYTILSASPSNAARLDPAPVGISYEFFTFPSYRTNVSATAQCELHLRDAYGAPMPIRIGGTTQDRADYDSTFSGYVTYSVSSDKDAPKTLKFGPKFFEAAGQYEGSVVLGLNRGHANLANTVEAARKARSVMKNLVGVEMGNEPEYFKSDGQPIAKGTWNSATDAASQANWQIEVGGAVGNIIQASNSLQSPPAWGAEQLLSVQNSTALGYVKTFSHHNYPGGSIQSLMDHRNVVKNVAGFKTDVEKARKAGKEYVFGETNSATGGGAASVSPSFGAALWVASVSLRATSSSISRLYFHHGTIGACQYCWFGRYSMGAPYYGAIFAASAFGGGSSIIALDKGTDAFAAYVVFGSEGNPVRVALVNTEYFTGGPRGSHTFVLEGLKSVGSVEVKRLTAPSATSRVDQGGSPTWGGQKFEDGTCKIAGTEVKESVKIGAGAASVSVGASEAALVYL